MKKINPYIITFLFGVSTMLLSCEKEYFPPVTYDSTIPVLFSTDIQPIFTESCAKSGCHIAGGIAPNLVEGTAYSDLFTYNLIDTVNDEASELYVRMNSTSNPMPPTGKLSADKIAKVLAWIQQGAIEN